MAGYAAYRVTQIGKGSNESQSASVLRQQKQQSRINEAALSNSPMPAMNRSDEQGATGRWRGFRSEKIDGAAIGRESEYAVGIKAVSDKSSVSANEGAHAAAAPVRLATDALLRTAWTSAFGTFGLSLIWVNIHVFMRYVLGRAFFSRLGHEWLSGRGKMLKNAGKSAETAQSAMGLVEGLILATVNFLLFFSIVSFLTLIAFAVGLIAHPIQFIGMAIFG